MMKKYLLLAFIALTFFNCAVTESVTFNENGSGEFLLNYDMSTFMTTMKEKMGNNTNSEKKGKVEDTLIVFNDIMEIYKDSLASLPKKQQTAMGSLRNMYMKMHIDEDKDEFDFGIGMNFKSVDELDSLGQKLNNAKRVGDQKGQVDGMKNSPLGKYLGDDGRDVKYSYTPTTFTRATILPEGYDKEAIAELLSDEKEDEKEISDEFGKAYYEVKFNFPKPIKSIDIKDVHISEDRKTVTCKVKWVDYLKNPELLDFKVTFDDK